MLGTKQSPFVTRRIDPARCGKLLETEGREGYGSRYLAMVLCVKVGKRANEACAVASVLSGPRRAPSPTMPTRLTETRAAYRTEFDAPLSEIR